MTVFRLLVIALLSVMFETAIPIAMGSAEAPDVLTEAVHRPRSHTTITLVRELPATKVERQTEIASTHLRRHVGLTPVRAFTQRQSVRKAPPPGTDPPAHFEDH